MTAISIRNLGKRYRAFSSPLERLKEIAFPSATQHSREFVALQNVNLEIPRGCAVGVIGPNGAGKSTLLKILAGIIDPSEGEVHVNGKIASIIELGAGFHPDFTGRQNVFLNATIMGYSSAHSRRVYDDIVRFCELGKYMDMPVKTYSSGMFVRLAFAVAISAEPEILLVDEALAVGDAVFAHRCLSRIREMRDRGVTIVFVSHDTNTIAGVCDRAIFIDRGQLVADGPPKDVIHLYLLNVAERLTTLNERGNAAAAFHEVGAVASTSEDSERRFGSFQARITDIFIEDEAGARLEKIVTGTATVVRMIVRFDHGIGNPVFGVMIRNRFGVEIFGTNTYLRKMGTGDFQHGDTLEVRFRIPMMLGAGVYSVSVAVHTAGGHFFDYRVDARVFEVVGVTDTIGIASLPAQIGFRRVGREAASEDGLLEKIYSAAPSEIFMGSDAEPFLTGEWYAPQHQDDLVCRWMGRTAQVFIRIPQRAAAIQALVRTFCPEAPQNPLVVDCFVGDEKAATAQIAGFEWTEIEIPAPAAMRGRVVGVRLCADRTWVPRDYDHQSTDTRELSVLVAHARAV